MLLKSVPIHVLGCSVVWFTICFALIEGTARHDAEIRLRADLFKNYSKDVLPPHGDNPVITKFGLSVISIAFVYPRSQEMHTQAWLKMEWKDSRLKWDEQAYNNITTLRIPGSEVWKPDIELYNSPHSPGLLRVSVFALVYPNGMVVWIPPVQVVSNCEFDLKYYPYDTHVCQYKFGSWTHSASDIQLELYGNSTTIDLDNVWSKSGEWNIIGSRAVINNIKYACCEESYSDATFYITIQRRSPFYKATLLCPVIAVVFLILISFWISPIAYEKIILNIVAFLSLILLMSQLANRLPATGVYVPLIVNFSAVLMFLAVLVIGESIFVRCFIASRNHQGTPHWVNILLNSWLGKVFCISPLVPFESLNSADDPSNLVGDDESKRLGGLSSTQHRNQWIPFFQLIDRVLFTIFLIIIFSLLLAVAS